MQNINSAALNIFRIKFVCRELYIKNSNDPKLLKYNQSSHDIVRFLYSKLKQIYKVSVVIPDIKIKTCFHML